MRRIEEAEIREAELDPVPRMPRSSFRHEKRYGYVRCAVAFRVYPKRAVLGAALIDTPVVPVQRRSSHVRGLEGLHRKFYHVRNKAVPLSASRVAVGTAGPAAAGPLVRHARAQEDDLGHIIIRGHAGRQCLDVRSGGVTPRPTFIWIVVFSRVRGASEGYDLSEILPDRDQGRGVPSFSAIAQVFGAIGPTFYGLPVF